MAVHNPVFEHNVEVARQINAEARQNPQSPFANKWVGIANGQVVAVADTFDEMEGCLRQAERDLSKVLRLEASRDYREAEAACGSAFPLQVPKGPRSIAPYSANPMYEVNRQLAMKINAETDTSRRSPPHVRG